MNDIEQQLEQVQRKYYSELGHDWNEATQIIDAIEGKVIRREFNFLEFESDFRVGLVLSPPEPEPYYDDGEPRAQAYFRVLRTAYNTIYQGAETLDVGGEEILAAAKFKQWLKAQFKYDYEKIYLDLETDYLLWQPTPPPAPDLIPPPPPDDRFQLFLGDHLLALTEEDVITLNIPPGVWGVNALSGEAYLVDRHRTQFLALEPLQTVIVDRPYLQLRKSHGSTSPVRVSLRGKSSPYLPGTFIQLEAKPIRYLSHPKNTSRENRLTPPNVTVNVSFSPIGIDDPIRID